MVKLFYRRYIGKMDAITISVWNQRKINKKEGGGFLGCVRLMSNAIQRLKDTGCIHCSQLPGLHVITLLLFLDQRLDLTKANPNDTDQVKGQIVISLLSRDQHSSSSHSNSSTPVVQTVVDALGNVTSPALGIQESPAASAPLPTGTFSYSADSWLLY